ncbi:hypothetical protein AOLI_G00270150 [Acnodon oligacanthus]
MAFETGGHECKLQFLRPNRTRRNSLFLVVERILCIQREQGEKAIRNVCTALKIKMLNPADMGFLAEYTAVMNPVAMALDILQGESHVHMGFLLPTLSQLQEKLKKLKSSCKVCRSLPAALQTGIQKRFREVSQDPELIAAAILPPKFRTCWTTEEVILKAGLDYIRNHLEENLDEDVLANSSHSDEEDFFAAVKSENLQAGELESIQRLVIGSAWIVSINLHLWFDGFSLRICKVYVSEIFSRKVLKRMVVICLLLIQQFYGFGLGFSLDLILQIFCQISAGFRTVFSGLELLA